MFICFYTDKKTKVTLDHLELLPCGHQNNLRLKDREEGVCPKGCGTYERKPELEE